MAVGQGMNHGLERGPWDSFGPIKIQTVVQGCADLFLSIVRDGMVGLACVVGLTLVCALALALVHAPFRDDIWRDWGALYHHYRRQRANARDAFEWKGKIYYLQYPETENRGWIIGLCCGLMILIGLLKMPEGVVLQGFCAAALLAALATPRWRAIEPPSYQKLVEAFQVFCIYAEIDYRLIPDKLWKSMALQGALAYRAAYLLVEGDHHRRHKFAVRVMTAEINKMTFALKTYLQDGVFLPEDAVHQMLARLGVEPPYRRLAPPRPLTPEPLTPEPALAS